MTRFVMMRRAVIRSVASLAIEVLMASDKQFSPTTPTHVDKASSGDATPAPSCFCGSSHVHGKGQYAVAREDGAAIDPVCGMSVTIATAKHTCEHGGTT